MHVRDLDREIRKIGCQQTDYDTGRIHFEYYKSYAKGKQQIEHSENHAHDGNHHEHHGWLLERPFRNEKTNEAGDDRKRHSEITSLHKGGACKKIHEDRTNENERAGHQKIPLDKITTCFLAKKKIGGISMGWNRNRASGVIG